MDRLLGLCPIAIAVLWIAGICRFRGVALEPLHWLLLVTAAFAMFVIGRRTRARRPLPKLPENARAIPLAATIATIMAVIAAVAGGVLELVAENWYPSEVGWGLRTLWHAACAFASSYCSFLQRLLRVLPA